MNTVNDTTTGTHLTVWEFAVQQYLSCGYLWGEPDDLLSVEERLSAIEEAQRRAH